MQKQKNRTARHELVINEATCLQCGQPARQGCGCNDIDRPHDEPDLLLSLPDDLAPHTPAFNAGYGNEDEDDILPLPTENADLRDESERATSDQNKGFTEGDRVTWQSGTGRRRTGTILSIRRNDHTAEVFTSGRMPFVRMNLEDLAPAADNSKGPERRPVTNARYVGCDPLPY